MAYYLTVKTTQGEHLLDFEDDKVAAEAALEETLGYMRGARGSSPEPVKIAGQLVVVDTQITSAAIHEAI